MKEKLLKLAQKLGFASKIKEGKMTSDDWAKFAAEFKKEHGTDILKAIEEANKSKALKKEHQDALAALMNQDDVTVEEGEEPVAAEPVEDPDAEDPAEPGEEPVAANKPAKKVATTGEKVNLAAEIKKLQTKLEKLEGEPEKPADKKVAGEPGKKVNIMGTGHTKTHVLGFKADFFARTKPWNEVMATVKPMPSWSQKDQNAFKDEFDNYAESLANRIKYLQENGLMSILKNEKLATDSIDYSAFDNTGYGNEYVIRRQDALIAYLKSLPSVSSIFPVQYGVQNKMEMTNAFFGEFSQSWQSGKVYKGTFNMEPELAKVNKAMFKHSFTNLKQIEVEYIGYLNREGSDPMKWTLVEWLMMQTLIVLHNEQELRRVRGYRIEPIVGTAGHHMFASDGVVRRLRSYVEDFKLQPFTDLNMYTSSTILTYVETFLEYVNQIVPSMRGMYLYMNEKHVAWYKAAYRTKYGTDFDFSGKTFQIMDYTIDGIVPVPNMGNLCLMWITMPNNIELYEDQVGEMEKLYFQRDLEELIVASWWSEGTGAFRTGRKYASAALLAASARKYQYIFVTDPFTALADGATTADGSKNDKFKTVSNTGATDLTDITNAEEGVVYRIEIGHLTNATKIDKASKFSEITANFVPTAIGDFLEVYYNATTSKFIEVRRQQT
jgi:hypothetical protein